MKLETIVMIENCVSIICFTIYGTTSGAHIWKLQICWHSFIEANFHQFQRTVRLIL